MSIRTRSTGVVVIIAAIFSLTILFTATTAHAQSPCLVQRVINGSSCPFTMCLYDASGAVVCFNIAAGPAVTTNISLGVFIPIGAQDAFGNQYPFVAPPVPGCTPCFRLNPAAINCCGFICYDQSMCVFRVTPCAPPC